MSGEVLVKILPTGSKQVVEQLNLVGSKKFIQISRRMFDAVPVFDADMLFTDAERDSLMVVLQVPSTAELNCLVSSRLNRIVYQISHLANFLIEENFHFFVAATGTDFVLIVETWDSFRISLYEVLV